MQHNQQIITDFYTAFQQKNFKRMQELYADEARFSDEVFTDLNAEQVRAMWEMFCTKGKILNVDFFNVAANGNTVTGEWKARYVFSKTKRTVVNHIQSNFVLANSKIVKHTDTFNFHRWASQAFGISGFLLGWTPFFKSKVRKAAMANLQQFMQSSKK